MGLHDELFGLSEAIRYGSFFQLALPRNGAGPVSIAVDRDADPLALVTPVREVLGR